MNSSVYESSPLSKLLHLSGEKLTFVCQTSGGTGAGPMPIVSIEPTWAGSNVQEPRSANFSRTQNGGQTSKRIIVAIIGLIALA
jgi:hypothetical protein